MAKLNDGNTWAGGKVRDVSEHMMALYATDCPYSAMAPKGSKVFSSTPEWPFRTRPAAQTTPVIDATDVTESEMVDYEGLFGMLQGRVVQTRQPLGVGKRAQLMTKHYGRPKDKFKEYTELAIEAVALGMEVINLGFQDSYRETVNSKPRDMTRGFLRWIQTGTYVPVDLPIPAAAQSPAANKVTNRTTAATVTEDDVRQVMRNIATTTKRKKASYVFFVSPDMQETVNNFGYTQVQSSTSLPLRRFTTDASKKEIVLEVTSYAGSWGSIKLMPHLEMLSGSSSYATVYAATSDNTYGRPLAQQKMDAALAAATQVHGLLVNFDYIKLFEIQNPQITTLPNNGGGPNGMVDALWINAIENPQAHGAFYYVTP